jgi:ornithine decarboxylase
MAAVPPQPGSGAPSSTPYFSLCEARLRANAARFGHCFPDAEILYAVKANGAPAVLRAHARDGGRFEIASIGELRQLDEAAPGLDPSRILLGTAVKPAAAIEEAVARGMDRFAFDSEEELRKLARSAPGARVYLRLVVGDGGSVFSMSEKFGAQVVDGAALMHQAADLGLIPWGLSFNVGSQAGEARAWADAVDTIAPVVEQLLSAGVTLDALNLGGGFPNAYYGAEVVTLESIARHTSEALSRLPYVVPHLLLEPGRALVADAATLSTTVIGRAQRGARIWLYLDAGVYNALFEALACQGSARYRVTSSRPAQGPLGEFVLAGPTGDGLDVIDLGAVLPLNTELGDVLTLHEVGAYSASLASHFNGFEPAPTFAHAIGACDRCQSVHQPRLHPTGVGA